MIRDIRSLGTLIASSSENLQSLLLAFSTPISSSNSSEPTRTKLGAYLRLCWMRACILHPKSCLSFPPRPVLNSHTTKPSPCLSALCFCTAASAGSEASSPYAGLSVHSCSPAIIHSEIPTSQAAFILVNKSKFRQQDQKLSQRTAQCWT